jgi:hypothetical protein
MVVDPLHHVRRSSVHGAEELDVSAGSCSQPHLDRRDAQKLQVLFVCLILAPDILVLRQQ